MSFPFRGLAQAVEAVRPESFEVGAQLGQALGPRPIPAPRALAALAEQARLLEYSQMLRDGRARDGKPRGDLAGGQLAVAYQIQDLAAPRFGQSLQRVLHA